MSGAPIFTQSGLDQLDTLFSCYINVRLLCNITVLRRINHRSHQRLSLFGSSLRFSTCRIVFSAVGPGIIRQSSASATKSSRTGASSYDSGSNELVADSPELGEGAGLCQIVRERRLQSRLGRRCRLRSRELFCQIWTRAAGALCISY